MSLHGCQKRVYFFHFLILPGGRSAIKLKPFHVNILTSDSCPFRLYKFKPQNYIWANLNSFFLFRSQMKQTISLVIFLCLGISFLVAEPSERPRNHGEPWFSLPALDGSRPCLLSPHVRNPNLMITKITKCSQSRIGASLSIALRFWCLEVSPVFLTAQSFNDYLLYLIHNF